MNRWLLGLNVATHGLTARLLGVVPTAYMSEALIIPGAYYLVKDLGGDRGWVDTGINGYPASHPHFPHDRLVVPDHPP